MHALRRSGNGCKNGRSGGDDQSNLLHRNLKVELNCASCAQDKRLTSDTFPLANVATPQF
jgi:hypothetical protein